MKNLLLLTILLGTIACQGSGGAGPKVEVGLEKTTFTYTLYDDVIDTAFNPCGIGETRLENDNTIIVCNTKGEDRPYEYTAKYWPSVGCTEINTIDELKECGSERVKSQDVSHLEGLNDLYRISENDGGIGIFGVMTAENGGKGIVTTTSTSLTITPTYLDINGDWTLTLHTGGNVEGEYKDNDNDLTSNVLSWWIEDEVIVIETHGGLVEFKGSRE